MTAELKEEMYGPQESGRKLKNNYVKHTNVTGQDNATLPPSYILAEIILDLIFLMGNLVETTQLYSRNLRSRFPS